MFGLNRKKETFMNRKKIIIFGIFLVMIPTIFTSCISSILGISMLYNTRTAEFSQLNNGGKVAEAKGFLKEVDFQDSNFFVTDIPNKYFTNLNVQIFKLIMKNLKNGSFSPYPDEEYENYKKELGVREAISYYPNDGIIIFCNEFQKKDGKNGTMSYRFALDIDQQAYKEWTENLAYIKKCDEQIESCNWIIDNCSDKTIIEPEVVQVPVTKRDKYWVPGDSGIRAGGATGWTYTEGTPGHYEYGEPYIDYEDRVYFNTVENPNYNPAKVAQAKQDLPSWQKGKADTLEKMKYLKKHLPFTLTNLGEGD